MNKHTTKIRTFKLWTYDMSVGRSAAKSSRQKLKGPNLATLEKSHYER